MSRQVRNRVTATALGVFLLGAALLTTGTANAEQVAGGGRQVVFAGGGGVLGLSCRSTPSVESMTIPADGTVRLVNRTGYASRLRLDGESMGTIPDDGSTEVAFRRGTTAVTLDPTCAITDQATPVLVTASPRMPTLPDPIPTPEDPEPTPAPTMAAPDDPDAPDEPKDGTSTLPGPAVPTSRPSARPSTVRPDSTKSRVATRSATTRASRAAARSAATAVQAMPLGGAASRVQTRSQAPGTAGAVVPAFSGMPLGDDRALLPGVPTLELPAPPETAPALPAGPPSDIVAAEPVAAMRPLPDPQPIGMLAVIATIMVVGVSTGVIRTFVSQRASRASVA